MRRRFNQEVLDYVVNPFIAGIFAGDPEQLSVRHAFPTAARTGAEPGFGRQGVCTDDEDAAGRQGRARGGSGDHLFSWWAPGIA